MSDDPEWFAPKRYGIGSGLPISWQGWVVLLVYLALLGLASLVMRYSFIGYISIVVMLTVILIVICLRTTRGGWRWRWGEGD
jgi:hypothetical protein